MDIEVKVREIMSDFVDDIPEDVEFDLVESGLIDSMMVMNLLTTIEDEFDFEVDVKDISKNNFKSISSIVQMIQKYVG